MTNTYTIHVLGNNEPNLLPRIALVFNRRRVYIKSLNASELNNRSQYSYTLTVETTPEWACRIARQLEKQIDVHSVNYFVHIPVNADKAVKPELAYCA